MIESIKIDIGLVVGDSDDCDFCCPFIRNKEPFKRALVSILMWLTDGDGHLYLPQYHVQYSFGYDRPLLTIHKYKSLCFVESKLLKRKYLSKGLCKNNNEVRNIKLSGWLIPSKLKTTIISPYCHGEGMQQYVGSSSKCPKILSRKIWHWWWQ